MEPEGNEAWKSWQGMEFEDLVGLASYLSFAVRSEKEVLDRGVMLGYSFYQKTNGKAV